MKTLKTYLKEDQIDDKKMDQLEEIEKSAYRLMAQIGELEDLDRAEGASGAYDLTDQIVTMDKHMQGMIEVIRRAFKIVPTNEPVTGESVDENISNIPINEWWSEWQSATANFPSRGKYIRVFGYDPSSKEGVKAFVKQNPSWIQKMGQIYGKYANVGSILGRAFAPPGMNVDKAVQIRDKVKNKYPKAFKQFAQGDAGAALKTIGVTDSVARQHIQNIMFEAAIEAAEEIVTEHQELQLLKRNAGL